MKNDSKRIVRVRAQRNDYKFCRGCNESVAVRDFEPNGLSRDGLHFVCVRHPSWSPADRFIGG